MANNREKLENAIYKAMCERFPYIGENEHRRNTLKNELPKQDDKIINALKKLYIGEGATK